MILRRSPNFNDRPEGPDIKYLILHYTGMKTAEEALERLCDSASQVSAHYVIEENGQVISLVSEEKRAWHSGVSEWEGNKDINGLSIGIELVNPGHDSETEFGKYIGDYRPFPELQMQSLIRLCKDIFSRHDIKPCYVLGHSDVAVGRKIDPGELFDWKRLAREGIGIWAEGDKNFPASHIDIFRQKLRQFGYQVPPSGKITDTVIAFQRHFRPRDFSGTIDGECSSLLQNLLHLKKVI